MAPGTRPASRPGSRRTPLDGEWGFCSASSPWTTSHTPTNQARKQASHAQPSPGAARHLVALHHLGLVDLHIPGLLVLHHLVLLVLVISSCTSSSWSTTSPRLNSCGLLW